MYCMGSHSDLYDVLGTAAMYAILCHSGSRYNGTRLYLSYHWRRQSIEPGNPKQYHQGACWTGHLVWMWNRNGTREFITSHYRSLLLKLHWNLKHSDSNGYCGPAEKHVSSDLMEDVDLHSGTKNYIANNCSIHLKRHQHISFFCFPQTHRM